MKAVILAGGLGTRLSEETYLKPKPMVEIGGRPIIWHIMKHYSHHGINDFIICCGYKGYILKEYFSNYLMHMSDVEVDLTKNSVNIIHPRSEPWKVKLIDTGENTMTGGRLLRIRKYLEDDSSFCMTYGDGLSNINIKKSIEFHRSHERIATLSAVYPPGRFGALTLNDKLVTNFSEKPRGDGAAINGGFFVLNIEAINYIDGDSTVWEETPLRKLAQDGELMAFEHTDFWHPMDTVRDKQKLQSLWDAGKAPWATWR
ncbi:glucose-1-phosphate cytidylyltransferase [Roseobacter sp. HKCC-CH-9208]|uniref:glucose-1-phosphate cytidylyltransferase n=1 Tax=Roseobacter sp. HKCC-CH-9208 TaxID=3120339 RepID=UPI0030EBBEB3